METPTDDTQPIDERPKLKPDPLGDEEPEVTESLSLRFRHWLKRHFDR